MNHNINWKIVLPDDEEYNKSDNDEYDDKWNCDGQSDGLTSIRNGPWHKTQHQWSQSEEDGKKMENRSLDLTKDL